VVVAGRERVASRQVRRQVVLGGEKRKREK
jgi:hypothetical protein